MSTSRRLSVHREPPATVWWPPGFVLVPGTYPRVLMHLNQARSLRDLTAIPGNRLEALKGTRKGQYSIRINDQYRICFIWMDGDACAVEITDYH